MLAISIQCSATIESSRCSASAFRRSSFSSSSASTPAADAIADVDADWTPVAAAEWPECTSDICTGGGFGSVWRVGC